MAPLKKEQVFNLPNLITLVRVGSIPLLVAMLYLPPMGWHWAAGALFFVAGLSDLADGFLARRLKKVTVLGQFLDPLADKLLVASMLIMLVMLGRAAAWAAIIIIAREVAVTGLRALAATQGLAVPSDRWGKAKTALQMLAVLLLMLPGMVGVIDPQYWGSLALWAATLVSLVSGLRYFVRFNRLYMGRDE
ncbi:MAG: CDP-diacylglycerol--glycerol-3-phosphate 3-phosphatidyltransferase [Desulfarculaceae bacterium]|nr:CDP-diacylglycerol--glycerol-3-phosphate 3-phosphatidyltransferase [Desulfarculaceae bacterium]MCF8073470.1 CDP-diacylglycerol--glycerol-3-phosphate 3-phosphatidyltransferase [Desulfarculaceae bacterium]MCF8100383.1 CDP-diacylglycerol--glycerol-3-phosphate 3-phosphatidyltransferase [Desulfarculaceae bacterium]MCF8115881.1 CDP-diacylglycerol--glycerol-3-phosphate 3-phosphatidyltransferase [Desulfarculaceae bacterium]